MTLEHVFSELTVWHWLVFGIVLLGIELLTGTLDFLMIALAAWAAAAFGKLAPESLATPQNQMVFFGVAAIVLLVAGRTVLSGFRRNSTEHPTLNRRMDSLVGQSGVATVDFDGGRGQVKIGDTMWGADAVAGNIIRAGDTIIVEAARGNTPLVRKG